MGEENFIFWKQVFLINWIMYAAHACLTVMLCFTVLWYPCGRFGHYGHCVGCLVHLGMIILTGVSRYSENGMLCSDLKSRVVYGADGESSFEYAEHGKRLETLFIIACTLFCFYNFFISALSMKSEQVKTHIIPDCGIKNKTKDTDGEKEDDPTKPA